MPRSPWAITLNCTKDEEGQDEDKDENVLEDAAGDAGFGLSLLPASPRAVQPSSPRFADQPKISAPQIFSPAKNSGLTAFVSVSSLEISTA